MRAIRHKHDGFDPQILENRCSAGILAGIGGVSELHIRFGLRQALRLEGATSYERQMPIASPFLIEPNDHSCPLLLDQRLGNLHLLAAVALDAVEDMRGN